MRVEHTNIVYLQASDKARGVLPYIINGFELCPIELCPIEGKRVTFSEGARVWWLNDTESAKIRVFLSKRAKVAQMCSRLIESLKEEAQTYGHDGGRI